MDKDTKTFVGTSATKFATECGIVIRNVCPMNFHTWDSVPKEVKTLMYEKLEGSFELLRADNIFMEYVDARLRAQWKRTRGVLSQHWKKNGGKTNLLAARSNMKPDCRSEEDWNHLCNYWELEKTRWETSTSKPSSSQAITTLINIRPMDATFEPHSQPQICPQSITEETIASCTS
ncbi:hypothetical protein E3N88_29192 [Mikania micrantha]|uniref:Uncharacterized protein n=1 Tax=Mikania micrantha TaxID=192012 RepID=A0A5N6MJ14_9ASTR|nr:hypothetical protein E3N88_29192 [Mikania micrantha]